MNNCPMCFSAISDDNPALVAVVIDKAGIDWDDFGSGRWKSYNVGDTYHIEGVGDAEVIQVKLYDGPPGWSSDELPQGTEFEAFVVLKVGEHFYRKTGAGNSYNDITWAGPVFPVKATSKTVTVYEF